MALLHNLLYAFGGYATTPKKAVSLDRVALRDQQRLMNLPLWPDVYKSQKVSHEVHRS